MDRKRAWTIVAALALMASSANIASAADPPGPPDAPVFVAGAGGDEQALLSWIPPVYDGGSPIVGYAVTYYIGGVVVYQSYPNIPPDVTSFLLTGDEWLMVNWGPIRIGLQAYNAYGGGGTTLTEEFWIWDGAPAPQVTLQPVAATGGSVTTDPGGTGPTPAAPVTTTVSVPATATGGIVSIGEGAVPAFDTPAGFYLFGQQILIESTAPTDPGHPLTLTFRVDPSLVPVTVLHNGEPVETTCAPAGQALPESPCLASGGATDTITILSATASTWSFAIRPYAFGGFSSPVDNRPVTNSAKPGSVIPVRFGLGGNQGTNVLAAGYPKSGQVACDASGPADAIEETVGSASPLSYHGGTGLYQYGWKTQTAWGNTCREFVLKFRDGSEARATFKFR